MLPQREPGNDWSEALPPVREPGQDWRAEALPRLPSVRELATLFQAKPSPEPLPRRSLLKVKTIDIKTLFYTRGLGLVVLYVMVSQQYSFYL
jgi:hypothetical protein